MQVSARSLVQVLTLCVLAAAAALLVLVPRAGAADRKVPVGFFGVNYAGEIELYPPGLQSAVWDRLTRAGVESARVVFNWDMAEKKRGAIDWSRMDNAVRFASQRKIRLLPTVLNTPPWARRYSEQPVSPPAKTVYYTNFLKKLIGRYGPDGTFWQANPKVPKRPLRQWQIWNEVELQFQWYRPETTWQAKHAAAFGELLRASHKAVHAADSGAKVVLPALAIDSWRKLPKLYKHGRIKGHFDIAAIQPMAGSPSYLPTLLRDFRKVLDRHGDNKVPLFGTELAQPASEGRSPPLGYAVGYMDHYATTDSGMAQHLRASYNLLSKKSFRKEVKLKRLLWFTAISSYSGSFEYDYSGLLWQRGTKVDAKPAFRAYREVAQKWEGCKKDARGNCL